MAEVLVIVRVTPEVTASMEYPVSVYVVAVKVSVGSFEIGFVNPGTVNIS